jgi:hypothetical protein
MLSPVLAQIPTMTGVGVKINTPSDSVSVPVGDLTIYGASSDNNTTNCQVYADWNDLKPMQVVTADGPKGDSDYSEWSYTYNGDYHDIVEGSNDLTSKITCYDQAQKLATSKSYSINVTGTKVESEIGNNTANLNTANEDTKILPVKSSSSNSESSNDTVEKSSESTDSDNEDTNVIPVKNILPLYSESNEESIKSASAEDADEIVASTDTAELQDEPTSKEIVDSDSETYATVSSKQQGEIGELNTIDMNESETTEASDDGLTSHSESNTFFTFEPDLVADEFSNNDEKTVGISSTTDSSSSKPDSNDNSIFELKFNGLDDASKNKIEKKIEKLEDRVVDRVQMFDLIG